MSVTVDTNVLVYSSDLRSPHHERALELLTSLAVGTSLVYLLWPVIMGYLRIITHSRIFDEPLTPGDAIGNISNLLEHSNIQTVSETVGFFPVYATINARMSPRGNLVPDAHIVALMRQHGIDTIWTADTDFRKFEGVKVRNPFVQEP